MSSRALRLPLALACLGALMLSLVPASAEDGGRRAGNADVGAVSGGGSIHDGDEGRSFIEMRRRPERGDLGRFRPETVIRVERSSSDRRFDRREGYRYPGAEGRGDGGFERRERRDGSFVLYRDGRRWNRDDRRAHTVDDRHDRDGYGVSGYGGSRTLTTFDVGDGGGSFIIDGEPPAMGAASYGSGFVIESGPKIIDVATERLDRRPIGPSGIDIVQTGGAKIIRIAPGYRMADAARRAERNVGHDLGLQPWSGAWLSWCTKTYRSFDPDLGTYVARNGSVRFCTAE